MCLFSIKILKTYCPNLTSTPPCPASMTIEYSGFGMDEVSMATTEITLARIKQTHNTATIVFFFIVKNLSFIKIFYLLLEKL